MKSGLSSAFVEPTKVESLSRQFFGAHAHRAPQMTNASMISPFADAFMIGGASIVVCILYWLFVDSAASLVNVGLFSYYLSFIVNYPHFAASYQLMYGDYRGQILKKKKFFWAAVVAPVLIIAGISYGVTSARPEVLAFMVQTMFLTVGWHYVKQIYGVSLVASAVQKRYFGMWEKNLILLNLYSVWAMSFVSANIAINKADLDGVEYFTLGLPSWMLTAVYIWTALTLISVIVVMTRKYILTGVRPATTSLIGFASIYVWYLPALSHPLFFYVIPFFHSLQYMLFVYTLKKNEATTLAAARTHEIEQRKTFLKKFFGFFVVAAAVGSMGFVILPRTLDAIYPIGASLTAPAVWFFGFNLFINLHHYFIDNVIWRGDNEALKTYLVQASQKRVAS